MGFARFMATPFGRVLRVLAGVALISLGIAFGGTLGIVLGLVGLVPLLAGLFNVCIMAPILRAPFSGRKLMEGSSGA